MYMTSHSGQENSAEPLPSSQDQLTESAPSAPGQEPKRVVSGWVRDVVISLAVSAFFIIFLYQPVKVEGTSMMPTLQDQERVFINKFVYKLEPIERGDVIVFRYPRDPAKSYIKRVIAVAGDSVRIEAGVVFVNGHRLSEQYLPECTKTSAPIRTPWCRPLLFRPRRPPKSFQRQSRFRFRG